MKIKYSRYIWLSSELLIVTLFLVNSVIECFRIKAEYKLYLLFTAYFFAVTVSFVANTSSQIYLLCELRSRVSLLEDSFSKIFKGIFTSSSDSTLLKLHIEKYRNLHGILRSITKYMYDFNSFITFLSICRWFSTLLYVFWRFYSYRFDTGQTINVLVVCLQLLLLNQFYQNSTDIVSILFIF